MVATKPSRSEDEIRCSLRTDRTKKKSHSRPAIFHRSFFSLATHGTLFIKLMCTWVEKWCDNWINWDSFQNVHEYVLDEIQWPDLLSHCTTKSNWAMHDRRPKCAPITHWNVLRPENGTQLSGSDDDDDDDNCAKRRTCLHSMEWNCRLIGIYMVPLVSKLWLIETEDNIDR